MRHLALCLLFCGLAGATIAAEPERPIKPYPPVAITFSAPPNDDSFVRFRGELAAVAKARIYAALALEHNDGSGWTRLAALAAEAVVEPLESRPGVVCAPARPSYDGVAFARLLDITYTTASTWAYPLAPETKVQAAPQPNAVVVATLGPYFIRRLGFEGSDDEAARTLWTRVATPDGKPGFVAPGLLRSLASARLCYIKDPIGGWRIAGTVAGEN